jgi:uncharacterized membrane protein
MFAFHPLDPRGARTRLVTAAALGAITWLLTPASLTAVPRGLLAGDVAGVALLAIAGWIILRADSDETRRRAAAEDPGRLVVWVIVLGVSAISLFASIFVMRHARALPHEDRLALLILGLVTAALAWLLTHTAFTLRYAHLFYRAGEADEGGIEFPGGNKPDDLDFAYFAFTIGMCFQVSDAQVTNRLIRRTVLTHALISFVYNTGIIALVINVVLAQLS